MKALELINVSKSFFDELAVDQVSFTLDYGEILALLGPNGAGKTTTLNMIAGFLAPSSGLIRIHGGWSHQEHYRKIKNHIGLLTSDMKLYEKFTVRECLEFIGEIRNISTHQLELKIEELYHMFEMEDYMEKRFNELSSGQRQRSLIATTLVHDPQILILDEITSNLDVPTGRLIMDFLKKQKSLGKAVLFSTHILTEAEYLSDKIAIIHDGKIMEKTSSEKFMKKHNARNLTDAFCEAIRKYKETKDLD